MLKNSMGRISNLPEERNFNREIKPIKIDTKRNTRNGNKLGYRIDLMTLAADWIEKKIN